MLTDNLKEDLIKFILKKVGGNHPYPSAHFNSTVAKIKRLVESSVGDNLCLSIYYGVTFQIVRSSSVFNEPKKISARYNSLISKEFFKKLLKHHEQTLLCSSEIRQQFEAVHLNSFKELTPLGFEELFLTFNNFLVSNFQATVTLPDFVRFVEQKLDLVDLDELKRSDASEEPSNESKEREIEPPMVDLETPPLNWDALSATFQQILESFATQMKTVIATDPLFEACDYDEKQLAFILNGPTSIKQRLIDALEKDRTYLRNEKGYFVKNERELIWNLMNSLCNLHTEDVPFDLTTQEMIGLNELYDLMTASEKGYEYYYHQFLKEFEQMRANQHVSDGFSTQVKHVLKSLNALHLECLFN